MTCRPASRWMSRLIRNAEATINQDTTKKED